ncbi:UDP-glucose 4-epimerase [Endomicrobiia bacterium]|nr:UDP-glucose 4-epimerase [Endomicrobiia bacterium]
MKTMLVTGGAGFIGSHLCDVLLTLGHNVIALDNLYLGCRENVFLAEKNPNFKFIKADILDDAALEKVFNNHRFDTVFHLAANSDIARSSSDTSVDLNLTFMTTFRVLDAMRAHGVKKIVFSSTSAIYGQTGGKAVAEEYGPLLPASHYGAGKLASEGFIASFVENYGFKAWITRFPNVCGERTTHGILHDFIAKLRANPNQLEVLGDGTQAKPYLYVKDLVEAILFVCDNVDDKINVFNIGTEGQTLVSDIARMVIDSMGFSTKICYTGGDRGWVGDVPKFAYNLDKIHSLGWRATNTSDQAVQHAINAMLSTEMAK